MKRKNFLIACGGSSALAFLAGCNKVYYAANTEAGKDIAVDLSEFDAVKDGFTVKRDFVLVKNDWLRFPIAVYRNSDEHYTALYLECTHRGCELRPAPTILQCPCHGSEFSTTGKVVHSPAERDLLQFPVTVNRHQLLIQLPEQ